MKTTHSIKHALLQVTFVSAVLLVASCDNNQTSRDSRDTKDAAEEQNDRRFDDNKQQKDAQFLVDAAEMNLEQIHLGRLAQQNARTTEVRELGKMMEDVHTKSQRELAGLAQRKNIIIPTAPTENANNAYRSLNEKSGDDFDKAYTDKTVSRHKDAIKTFENASTDSNDRDIQNWASTTLPELRKHYDHSVDCQKKFADMHMERNN